jgi:nucleoside-diphosphate-sugar epimerase
MEESILVTGCNGLVGEQVVHGLLNKGYRVTGVGIEELCRIQDTKLRYISVDLTQTAEVARLFNENNFSHVIHLAAIAHHVKGVKITWSQYYRINTMMSRQIFELASRDNIPIFFASTVDVYGIQKEEINEETEPCPIGYYARSKFIAENILKEVSIQPYLIARFAPIYTSNNRKDIHRRYYIRYPRIAYLIANGLDYGFLDSNNVVNLILKWLSASDDMCGIINVCDLQKHNTKNMIEADRRNGSASIVIRIPSWFINIILFVTNIAFCRRPLLKFSAYKIIRPMRFDRSRLKKLMGITESEDLITLTAEK